MILWGQKYFLLLKKVKASVLREGLAPTFHKIRYYLAQNKDLIVFHKGKNNYEKWLQNRQVLEKNARREIEKFDRYPVFSIIMPVYNVAEKWLSRAIESVTDQYYQQWELCIVDDGSTHPEALEYLKNINDPKIKVFFSHTNEGIARASNRAIEMASGTHVAFLDHDDLLTKDALYQVARVINEKDPDFIYSDEDKIDQNEERKNPFFKPDWSPDLLRCQNYICHLSVIKRSLVESAGGFADGFDGAQDHDLFLRITERTARIHHIPKVLYSWREIDSSTAGNPNSKPDAHINGQMAIDNHVKRKYGPACRVTESRYLFVYDVRFPLDPSVMVSIIIPTKDRIDLLQPCIESILEKSSFPNFEIIIMDNGSVEDASRQWLEEINDEHSQVRVVSADYPFCWSRLNNDGIKAARGDVFVFLNNDTVIISNDWLERLAEQALREDVGVVGPLLLYEDGTIQHAGVIVGLGGWADHIFKGMQPVHFGSPYVSPMVTRNVLAVTGSCQVIARKTIEQVGYFDEDFMICGSDVEICIRAYEAGLVNIYDPFVRVRHFESKTRIPQNIPKCDFDLSEKHYKHYRQPGGDPFFNENLSLNSTTPELI